MKIQVIKVWITLVASILLLLTVVIVFKVCQGSAQGYLTFVMLKTSFIKAASKQIYYRNYNKFNADNFKTELEKNLAISSTIAKSMNKH